MKCACGSGLDKQTCCEKYITGLMLAPTPEALMRSRYTAYTQANVDYIANTMRGAPAKGFDKQASLDWAQSAQWQSLKVLSADEDYVEFMAYYHLDDQDGCLYERSRFEQHQGQWYYVDGYQPSVGRNDPCPCGSQKKFKKCCLPKL